MRIPSTVFVMLLLGGVTVEAQGLGAAAQKEKEKRATKPKDPAMPAQPGATAPEAKVYTGTDLDEYGKTRPPEAEQVRASRAQRSGSRRLSSSPNDVNPPESSSPLHIPDDSDARAALEKDWRARIAAARSALAAAERELDAAQPKGVNVLGEARTYSGPNGEIKVVDLEKAARDREARLSRARAGLEKAKANLEQLEESARRQGVPSGWLR